MLQAYLDSVGLIERLHRQFLELVKEELDRLGIVDINNVQALLLFNIGEDELTVGELTTRGYYLGSNVSYNLKKTVEHGYLSQERSPHDRRSVRVRLSQKGRDLREKMAQIFERHAQSLAGTDLAEDNLAAANVTLRNLGRFWTDALSHAARMPAARPPEPKDRAVV